MPASYTRKNKSPRVFKIQSRKCTKRLELCPMERARIEFNEILSGAGKMCKAKSSTEADRKCDAIINLLKEVQKEFRQPLPSPDTICNNLEKAVEILKHQ